MLNYSNYVSLKTVLMKKILTFCVTTVLLLGVLFSTVPSCSSDETYSETKGQVDENESSPEPFALLNAQLDDYDAAFFASEISLDKKKDPNRGGFFRWLWRVIKVCVSDILGGVGGVVAKGDWCAGSSYLSGLAAKEQEKVRTNPDDNMQLASVRYAPVGELILPADNLLDSIGIRHNILIKSVYQNDPEGFFTCTDEELQQRIFEQHNKLFGPVPQEVVRALPVLKTRIDRVTNEVERLFLQQADENSSEEELVRSLKNALAITAIRMPEHEKELLVVMRYLETMLQLPENESIEVYTDGFRRIVGGSDLPDVSIGKINSGISIAVNSNFLWREVNTNN